MLRLILLFCLSILAHSYSIARNTKTFYETWEKGKLHCNISIPFFNQLYITPPEEPDYSNSSILGISTGVGYCYKNRRFVSLQFGALNASPVGESLPDSTGHVSSENYGSLFVSVRNNHVWKCFDGGYGLVFSSHNHRTFKSNVRTDTDTTKTYVNNGLGLSLSGYFRLARFFYAGVLYQPQFFSFRNSLHYQYEHSFSIELLFRFYRPKIKRQTLFSTRADRR